MVRLYNETHACETYHNVHTFINCPILFHSSFTVKHNNYDSVPTSTHPVDDFGLEGTDNAAVVEDWMFFIQLFKGCSCLAGKDKTHGYWRSVNCLKLGVFLFSHVVVTCSCAYVDTLLQDLTSTMSLAEATTCSAAFLTHTEKGATLSSR